MDQLSDPALFGAVRWWGETVVPVFVVWVLTFTRLPAERVVADLEREPRAIVRAGERSRSNTTKERVRIVGSC